MTKDADDLPEASAHLAAERWATVRPPLSVRTKKSKLKYVLTENFTDLDPCLPSITHGSNNQVLSGTIYKDAVSQRTLRHMLTQKVNRVWRRPAAVIVANQTGGCNTDRLLASVTMLRSSEPFIGIRYTGEVSFPAVPNTCLDPTKRIVVVFDYEFDEPPSTGFSWIVDLRSSGGGPDTAVNSKSISTNSRKDRLRITLDQDFLPASYPYQSAFTKTGQDPSVILIQVGTGWDTNWLKVTNVVIRFNQ
jgi:hypothetical protein